MHGLTQCRWWPEEYLPEGEPRVAHPRRARDPDEGHARGAGRVLAVFKRRFGFLVLPDRTARAWY